MCDPVTAGVATFASGAVGAFGQHDSQQTAYRNQVRATQRANQQTANQWNDYLKQRDFDWSNQLTIWGAKKAEYAQTLDENYTAAQKAFESEQVKLNEQFAAAAFAKQDILTQMVGARGTNAARGVSGKSVGKADQAILAAFGRNNAIMAANLASGRNQMIRNNMETSRQMDAANMRAWRQVQFAPRPTPVASQPMLNEMPQNPGSSGLWMGLGQAALSGFGTYASMKAPSAGDFGNNTQYSNFQGNIPSYSLGNTANINMGSISTPSWGTGMKWSSNNTFGIGL